MIKKIGQSMAAALAATVLMACPVAQAATTIDATGFSLSHLYSQTDNSFDMTLLSDTNGTVQIGLNMGAYGFSWDTSGAGSGSGGGLTAQQLAGTVKQGYRITSFTLSAVVVGNLVLEEPDLCGGCQVMFPGAAENSAAVALSAWKDSVPAPFVIDEVTNVNGTQAVAATVAGQIDGAFELDARTWAYVNAQETYVLYDHPDHVSEFWYDALAEADVQNFVLTVQVSAVPEPSTYAMLLAGLGVAGRAARRRRV